MMPVYDLAPLVRRFEEPPVLDHDKFIDQEVPPVFRLKLLFPNDVKMRTNYQDASYQVLVAVFSAAFSSSVVLPPRTFCKDAKLVLWCFISIFEQIPAVPILNFFYRKT